MWMSRLFCYMYCRRAAELSGVRAFPLPCSPDAGCWWCAPLEPPCGEHRLSGCYGRRLQQRRRNVRSRWSSLVAPPRLPPPPGQEVALSAVWSATRRGRCRPSARTRAVRSSLAGISCACSTPPVRQSSLALCGRRKLPTRRRGQSSRCPAPRCLRSCRAGTRAPRAGGSLV